MAFQGTMQAGRVISEHMKQADVASCRRPSGKLRASREDDWDCEAAGDEVDRVVVAAETGHAVDVDRLRGAVGGGPMDERRQIRVADEDPGVEVRRGVDWVMTVARDEDRRQPRSSVWVRHSSSPIAPGYWW
jgi:hypothetical protein